MSFLSDLTGDNGTGNALGQRMGNTAANTAKSMADAQLEKVLASESDPAKQVEAVLAHAGAQAVINKIISADKMTSPKPYSGMEDLGITMPARDYIVTPEHSYNTYFNRTHSGDTDYNDAHPMYTSLFLVDFVFNHKVLNGKTSNELFPLMNRAFPMSLSFLLKSMSFPKVSFETIKMNQYNKYVTRPKKIVYEPVNITFNDVYASVSSVDKNRVSLMTFMREYLSYYSNDIVKSGHKLQNGLSGDRSAFNFISSIDIYFFWNNGAKKLSLVNPFIDNFSYGDLGYEEDNVLNLSCNVQYEYLDMYDIDITLDDFMERAGHLVAEVSEGHLPEELNPNASLVDAKALQPIKNTADGQRNIGLDNPVAAMAVALAEQELLQRIGNDMNSDDPVKRALSEGAYSAGMDVATSTTNSVSGLVKGLF